MQNMSRLDKGYAYKKQLTLLFIAQLESVND